MFVNHITPEQMKQILQRNLLSRIIQPIEQKPKKRKVKKRNLSGKNGINGQINDQNQSQSSCSQHIKSQDVSLIKCKPDEQEDSIIKVYSETPSALKQEKQSKKENELQDKQEESMIKSSNTASSNKEQNKLIKKRSKNADQSSNKKHNTSMNDSDRENQIIQAYNLMQSSPYTDQKYKQRLRCSLKPIIESKSMERYNKQRKLQPLKESFNLQTSNNQYIVSNSFRLIDEKSHSNTSSIISSYKHPLLQLRPRSSSQKASPTRQIQSGFVNPIKINYSTLQDNISFYTQNTYRNGIQLNSHRSNSQNTPNEEKTMMTDYSIIIKNRKLLDEKLYSTQFKSIPKNPQSNINLSVPTQENTESTNNALENNGINFYDDSNTEKRYKIKIIRSNSSRKQNDSRLTSIEKIYKRKISQVIEAFSPTSIKKQSNSPRNKQKKKITSLVPKDIQLKQGTNKNNQSNKEDSALHTIQETNQTQSK